VLKVREERRLSVFDNAVLRRIFGSKRDEVTGGGENKNDHYSSPNIVQVIKLRRFIGLGM
jgi:hypothetical protein